jgi:hypothetical protein
LAHCQSSGTSSRDKFSGSGGMGPKKMARQDKIGSFLFVASGALALSYVPAFAWPSFNVDGVVVNPLPLPGVPPVVPAPVDDAAKKAAEAAKKAAADAAKAAADAAAAAAKAAANAAAAAAKAAADAAAAAATATAKNIALPTVVAIDVVTGKPADKSVQDTYAQNARALQSVGEAASTATEQAENTKVSVAGAFAGDFGQTVVQVVDGPVRLQEEFASTAVISGSKVLQGADAAQLIAAPFAAALRAANAQFQPIAQPIPASVKAQLIGVYPPAILDNARWAVSTVSISVPDVITHARKAWDGSDFAVTVGNIMVFDRDPAMNLHWWTHELQHTVQYANWGIDKFAYNYVTSCHSVEADAESHAQAAFPISPAAQLGC